MKKVIVFKEHYRSYMYDASSEYLILEACIAVLERRANSNHFRYFANGRKFIPTQTEQGYLDLTEEELNSLPKTILESITAIRKKLNLTINAIEREQFEALEWKTKLEAFLALSLEEKLVDKSPLVYLDGKQEFTAIWLLKKRAGYAGENFEIINLDIA